MDNNQLSNPPETEKGYGPPGRQWVFAGLGCLFISLVVIVAGTAALALMLNRDDVGQATETTQEPAGIVAQITTKGAVDRSTGTPAEPDELEAEVTETRPAESGQPTISPTLEPTPRPTVEPAATVLGDRQAAARQVAGRIAFVDNRSRLWTIAPDGSDRRMLSDPGRFYQFPSWSPAGNDIAVIGVDSESGGVYVVADEQDSQVRQLYEDPVAQPIYLYWSPAGEDVSFIANHSNGLALLIAPGDGQVEAEIVATSPGTFFWDWLPDGSQVLVHTGFSALRSNDTRLAFLPLDGSSEAVEIIEDGFFQAPAVAASGRYISYGDTDPAGNRWLVVRDINQDEQAGLIRHSGLVAMDFSPTRPQLAYTSPNVPGPSFYGPLSLIDLENADSRLLVPENVIAFFWSPDGRSIAYFTPVALETPFDSQDAPVAGLIGREIAVSGRGSPDGIEKGVLARVQSQDGEQTRLGLSLSIVDVNSGDSRLLMAFEPSNLFLNQFLPFFDQYAGSHRLWSPDSQALVLPMDNEEDLSYIVVVPVDGSAPLPIALGVAAFWSQQ